MTPPVREQDLRALIEEPSFRELLGGLPDAAVCEEGLCVDREPAPLLRMDGSARLSLVRVWSKGAGGARLVGQLQVVATAARRDAWALTYLVHDAHLPVAREVSDRVRWWDGVLARHRASATPSD